MENVMDDFMSGNIYWLATVFVFVMAALWIDVKGYDE